MASQADPCITVLPDRSYVRCHEQAFELYNVISVILQLSPEELMKSIDIEPVNVI